jgi:hypothetical protein
MRERERERARARTWRLSHGLEGIRGVNCWLDSSVGNSGGCMDCDRRQKGADSDGCKDLQSGNSAKGLGTRHGHGTDTGHGTEHGTVRLEGRANRLVGTEPVGRGTRSVSVSFGTRGRFGAYWVGALRLQCNRRRKRGLVT